MTHNEEPVEDAVTRRPSACRCCASPTLAACPVADDVAVDVDAALTGRVTG